MNKYISLFVLFTFILFVGCQTSVNLNSGIQPGFEAINPAAIIAVPILVLPDPSSEEASIDPSVLIAEKIVPLVENNIVQSNFVNQPNINGYSFLAVRKALELNQKNNTQIKNAQTKKVLQIESSSIEKKSTLDELNHSMLTVAQRFSSRDTKERLLITPKCFSRSSFIEFYSYCLSQEKSWLSALNSLSAQTLNADAALITVITNLNDKVVNNQYQISTDISVLLVDTNNGKLIWGNSKHAQLVNSNEKAFYPRWQDLFNSIFVPEFWKNFPGRIGENQLIQSDFKK